MTRDFTTVTEVSGEPVTRAQIHRLAQRYYWAGPYAQGKDALEVACGVGQGLGYLASVARSVRAGDITPALVSRAQAHYGERVPIAEMNAEALPYEASSLDVVILFEAIYYLQSAPRFIEECRRVLRPNGLILFAMANRDLFDFNPSPFSVKYYSVPELESLLRGSGFASSFFGGCAVPSDGLRQQLLRRAKRLAVGLRLIPESMRGKRFLKRLVFGKLVPMPRELPSGLPYEAPVPIPNDQPDTTHQVIYCAATLIEPDRGLARASKTAD